jgi:electron transport complex protein RnfD
MDADSIFAATSSHDNIIRSFLNDRVLSFFGVELPGSYIDLFTSRFPGIIADRGILALLVGTIIITAFAVNRFWIPVIYLSVFSILVRFAGAIPYGGNNWNGDTLFALCTGGTLAAAFFLASDPATGAKSNMGIILVAAAGGCIAFLFRYYGAEAYGVVFVAVFVNAITPLIRRFERYRFYERYLPNETSSRRSS